MRETARAFYKKSAERGGKPPKPKQFAGAAVGPANRWFGGDVSALYRAFGERVPVSSEQRTRLVPEDVEDFAKRMYAALGGVEVGTYPSPLNERKWEEHQRKVVANRRRSELVNMALDYLRLEEALGRPPTLKDIGRSKFEYRTKEAGLGPGIEGAWAHYERAVRESLVVGGVPDQQGRLTEDHRRYGNNQGGQPPKVRPTAARLGE